MPKCKQQSLTVLEENIEYVSDFGYERLHNKQDNLQTGKVITTKLKLKLHATEDTTDKVLKSNTCNI